MMKSILFPVLVIACFSAKAQVSYTIKIGAQNSRWRGDGMNVLNNITEWSGDYLKQGGYTSFYAGGSVNIPLGERFSIEPGLQYSKVGTQLAGNLSLKVLQIFGINASAAAISKRIELPVLAKAEIARGLYLVAGPQVNYAYNNKLHIKAGILGFNAINKKFDIDDAFEPFSAAALGGLQYQFPGGLQVQALYEYGLSKISSEGRADVYQNNIKIGMGLPLKFKKSQGY